VGERDRERERDREGEMIGFVCDNAERGSNEGERKVFIPEIIVGSHKTWWMV
jgi:hypothetical protein